MWMWLVDGLSQGAEPSWVSSSAQKPCFPVAAPDAMRCERRDLKIFAATTVTMEQVVCRRGEGSTVYGGVVVCCMWVLYVV